MKKTLRIAFSLAFALLLGGTVAAQVVETTNYDDGRTYTGQRNGRGKIEGQGRMTWPNGDVYDGQWKKGVFHGEGTYNFKSAGYIYTGQWEKGAIKGHGTFKFKNGDVMEGDWTAMGTGTGYRVFADGSRYDGSFLNGVFHGPGTMVWKNGDRYEGTFDMGHKHGRGTLIFASGSVYTGEFDSDKRQGNGVCKYADGARYEGSWANDLFEGKGTYTEADGTVLTGNWHLGILEEEK